MWKKTDTDDRTAQSYEYEPRAERPVPAATPTPTASAPSPSPAHQVRSGQAVIGRSISIKGEVTGDEDLLIEGRVDGSVSLAQHTLTVGPEGRVKANITARVVTVEGKVEGNITGDEQVVLRGSSSVEGDIQAPRVVLEDGTHFRGGIEMGEAKRDKQAGAAAKPATPAKAAEVKAGEVKPGEVKPAEVKSASAPAGTQGSGPQPNRGNAPREVVEVKR